MEQIMLLVTYTTKPGMRERFIQDIASSGLREKICSEEGVLCYAYYQSVQNSDQLLLVEKWVSEEYQKRHLQQPHMAQLKEIKERYVSSTAVECIRL